MFLFIADIDRDEPDKLLLFFVTVSSRMAQLQHSIVALVLLHLQLFLIFIE